MKRISLIRHGQSLGNKEHIIQGPKSDYDLTEDGYAEIAEMAVKNQKQFSLRTRVYASPLKRAKLTAQIISQVADIKEDVITSPLLVEFDPGILGGLSHKVAAEKYPEAYKVWLERKDLDKIPNAEKGSELQARVLAFLARYIGKDEYDDLIVTHAGFMRCFVNTVLGRDRTTPIDVQNGVMHEIENPLQHLSIEKRDRAMSSTVYIIGTHDGKYVVKQKNRPVNIIDREEKRVLNILDSKIHGLPIVYGLFDDNGESYKVLKHVGGEHKFGLLDREYEIALLRDFKLMSNHLAEVDSDVFETIDLIGDLNKMKQTSKAPYQKELALSLLTNYKNIIKLQRSKYVLSHDDLNRDNILFEKSNDGTIRANFIDWEGLKKCPKEYQIATFLTSSFLIEGYSVEKVMNLAEAIYPGIDKDFVSYLMQLRVFKGSHFFAEQRNEFTEANTSASTEILIKYYNASEQLKKYRIKEGFDVPSHESGIKLLEYKE